MTSWSTPRLSSSQNAVRLVQEPEREADAGGERHRGEEGRPRGRVGRHDQVEHDGPQQHRGHTPGQERERRPPDPRRQPPGLQVDGTVEVDDHVAGAHPLGQLRLAEGAGAGDQALGEEREGHERGLVPAADAPAARDGHGDEDVRAQVAEHRVGDHPRGRGHPVGRPPPEAAARDLPQEPHARPSPPRTHRRCGEDRRYRTIAGRRRDRWSRRGRRLGPTAAETSDRGRRAVRLRVRPPPQAAADGDEGPAGGQGRQPGRDDLGAAACPCPRGSPSVPTPAATTCAPAGPRGSPTRWPATWAGSRRR